MPRFRNGICQFLQCWLFRPTPARSKFCVSSFVLAIVTLNFIAIFIYSASVVYANNKSAAVLVRIDQETSNSETSGALRMLNSALTDVTDNSSDEIVATNIISAILNRFRDKNGHLSPRFVKLVLDSAKLTLPPPVISHNTSPKPISSRDKSHVHPIPNDITPQRQPTELPTPLDQNITESKQEAVVKVVSDENDTEKSSPSKLGSKDTNLKYVKETETQESHEKKAVPLKSCVEYTKGSLVGAIKPNLEDTTPEKVSGMFPQVQNGGHYSPTECIPKEKTAILIPYRNRYAHLHILLHNLLPLLLRQKIDFTIFVIDQALPDPFNRGMLFNVGFLEALKLGDFECFIYHDVDLIPINDSNFYHCNDAPTHFVAGVDKFNYSLIYSSMFGGVTAFTREQFEKINGASNLYFGWGAEDDDLRKRVMQKGYKPLRTDRSVGLYDMIKHKRDTKNEVNPARGAMLKTATKRMDDEGLNSTMYTTLKVDILPLYTWVSVNISMSDVLTTAPIYMKKEIDKLRLSYQFTDPKKKKA